MQCLNFGSDVVGIGQNEWYLCSDKCVFACFLPPIQKIIIECYCNLDTELAVRDTMENKTDTFPAHMELIDCLTLTLPLLTV